MLDKDPAPQGFENRCTYCGTILTGQNTIYEVIEHEGEISTPLHFCSEEHAKAYASQQENELQEEDVIGRAGPT